IGAAIEHNRANVELKRLTTQSSNTLGRTRSANDGTITSSGGAVHRFRSHTRGFGGAVRGLSGGTKQGKARTGQRCRDKGRGQDQRSSRPGGENAGGRRVCKKIPQEQFARPGTERVGRGDKQTR